MTEHDHRSFFRVLADLFAGLHKSRPKPGTVIERSTDTLEMVGEAGCCRYTYVTVENGPWIDCPSLGDKNGDGFEVTVVNQRTLIGEQAAEYTIGEASEDFVKHRTRIAEESH